MTVPDNNSKLLSPRTRLVILVSFAIVFALLIFRSIWLAYVLGLLIVALKASEEKAERIGHLFAYTALFIFVVIPIVYAIHTKTDTRLLSRDAERFIESIIDDGSERACYMGAC